MLLLSNVLRSELFFLIIWIGESSWFEGNIIDTLLLLVPF